MKSILVSLLLVTTAEAQVSSNEVSPTLKASEILKPEILSGPNHRVLDPVSTEQGRNHYTIETPWGYLQADGDAMLLARVAETNAVAELKKVSKTEEFKSGLKAAAKTPLNAVRGAVDDPAAAIKGTAKGVWKFMGRAKEGVKQVVEGNDRPKGQENLGKELLGFSKTKRQLALQLGADPYSSNELFQQELDNVAWVKTAGNGVFQIATLPIGGGVGLALTATEVTQTFQQSLRDMSPADLQVANRQKLLALGVDSSLTESFLQNPAFNPTTQTAFLGALQALEGVKNRATFVALAHETSTDEADARFCSGTAQLLAALHAGRDKLVQITTLGGLPVAIAADGRLVIALQWDTAFWSERVEQFIDYAATAKLGQTGQVVIAITGSASATTKAELAKRQIGILDHALPGPQK